MSWDWVPPRPGEDEPTRRSDRRLRLALTVLLVVFTGVLAVYYLTVGLDQMRTQCLADRPAGVSTSEVTTTWRWWPPGYDCGYPADGAQSA
ncbi:MULTISPECIES: hypothetical protein [Oerskovia]|uniref:Uncharacterized protein n=2 Tax=Oerskovia TaxID=162491 RepID=A0ABR8V2Q0_9CELL|nr:MULTISPECIES: hypothetical protein [Oerskovia]MBD7999052.1 hypothetical protein [Oerskovia gallyi]MBM7497111.1 hypothetical protein [Oerskovia paurometabola]